MKRLNDPTNAPMGALIIVLALLVGVLFGPCQDIVSPERDYQEEPP